MILDTMAKHLVIAKLVATHSPYQMIGLDGSGIVTTDVTLFLM